MHVIGFRCSPKGFSSHHEIQYEQGKADQGKAYRKKGQCQG